jgi:hypothetical protein
MGIFLFFRFIIVFFHFFSPFTDYFPFCIVHNMPRRPYLTFESKNSKTFHRFICLLESETVPLRSGVKTCIAFIESERNSSVKTGYSKSCSADSSTDNGNMWIICIDRWRVFRRQEARSCAMNTDIFMSYWLDW